MKYIKIIILSFLLMIGAVIPVKAATYTKGIDVSFYNGKIDWTKVKQQGNKFAIIRTGHGTTITDSQFVNNYNGAGKVGIKRGAYHFATATTAANAVKEAQYCLKILNGRKLEYPLAYDIEYNSILSTGKTNVTAVAKAFCDTVKKAGYVPMIYSSANYINNNFDWSKLPGVKVWVAHWNVSKPASKINYQIWQYKVGSVPGTEGECDLNYSYIDAYKITLNKSTLTLKEGNQYTLRASVLPSGTLDKIIFKSSNEKIAAISSKGVIKAKKAGKATITVQAGNVRAYCKITVKKWKLVSEQRRRAIG